MKKTLNSELTSELNLLFVEDDELVLKSLASRLKKNFRNVYTAVNGEQGMGVFLAEKVDIIITDYNMPVMDGLVMIEEIRKIDEDVPIILVTAQSDSEFLINAINLDVTRFISKPIKLEILYEAINRSLVREQLKQLTIKTQQQEIELMRHREKYTEDQLKNAYKKELKLLKNELGTKYIFTPSDGGCNKNEIIGFTVFYEPLEILSGDCYSLRRVGEHTYFGFIMDTMGKGVSASVTTMLSIAFLNHACDMGLENDGFKLRFTLERYINYIQKILLDDEMISASFFIIDLNSETMEYSFFGMPAMLVSEIGGGLKRIKSNNPPLSRYTFDFAADSVGVEGFEKILMYSDGLVEAGISENSMYLEDIENDFKESRFTRDFLKTVKSKITKFQDDVTFIGIRRLVLEPVDEQSFVINTKKDEVDDAIKSIEKRLQEICDDISVTARAATVFHEMMYNAYEHGNIKLSYEMKNLLIEKGTYEDELQRLEAECDKTIKVCYGVYEYNGLKFIGASVEDEGDGFNMNITDRAQTNVTYYNGRGILMSKIFADEIYYNDKGNEVRFFITI